MATYHLSAKPISRSAGRSATAAAAYRAGCEITDERTGQVHDYDRKSGVLHTKLVLPGGDTADRAAFWNGIEAHHKRGDAVLAREVEVSLPTELTLEQRQALAVDFARELADRYGVAADLALHAPRTVTDKELAANPDMHYETDAIGRRHNGNWHAHIMLSACHVSPTGELGKKAVELDPIHCKRHKIENMADRERGRWADLVNGALERAGHDQRIDHRSLKEQGIEREPTTHKGPAIAGMERRGASSEVGQRMAVEAAERLARAKEAGELEWQAHQAERSIIDVGGDLKAAVAERDQQLKIQREQENEQRINRSLGRIGSNVEAAGRARADADRALLASKQSILTATSHTRDIERGAQGAIQGAERRVAERDYGRVVEAARRQFKTADNLVQQIVGHLDHVIQPIAATAEQVAKQIALAADRAKGEAEARKAAGVADFRAQFEAGKQRAPLMAAKFAQIEAQIAAADLTPEQRAAVAARVLEITAKERASQPAPVPAPEKPDHLTANDRALVRRMDAAIESGDKAELKASYRALDEVENRAWRDTQNQSIPFHADRMAANIQRDTQSRLQSEMNREAKERGETITPWAEMGARYDTAYDHHASAAAEKLKFHRCSQRPEGFFKKSEGREWDAQLQKLEIAHTGWDSAVKRRNVVYADRLAAAEPGNAEQLERERAAHSAKTAQEAPERARAISRYESIKQERERQHTALERTLGADYERQLTRSRGMGR